MNTFLAGCFAILSAAAFIAALRMKQYADGKVEGSKLGYQKGFQEGHKAADDWWMNWEREVCKAREVIRNEEGWP